jgi:hypothetical protein
VDYCNLRTICRESLSPALLRTCEGHPSVFYEAVRSARIATLLHIKRETSVLKISKIKYSALFYDLFIHADENQFLGASLNTS